MGFAAIGHTRLVGPLTAGHLFRGSIAIGKVSQRIIGDRKKPGNGQPDSAREEPDKLVKIAS